MPKKRSQTTSFDVSMEGSLAPRRETIRKSYFTSDREDKIPIAVQIFLWRQSKPFIKHNFGNLTDASAIVFDQVLVRNILHGLSPSLTDAILSIPRWLLIKAAFPHVMHACSSIIEHNLHSMYQSFPSSHPSFVITTSPSRSPSALTQLQVPLTHQFPSTTLSNPLLLRPLSPLPNHSLNPIEIRLFHTLHHLLLNSNDRLLSLNIIQLFIYLFLPYIQTYFHPNEKEFLANADLSQGMRLIWQPLFEYQQPDIRIFNAFVKPIVSSDDQQRLSIVIEPPLVDSSSINTEGIRSNIFVLTESDPTTTTTQDSTTDLEGFGIIDNTKIRAPLVHMNSICSVSDISRPSVSPPSPAPDKPYIKSSDHLLRATYFDIAIIRTLFSPSWFTDGYLWCLEYLHKRLIDISDEMLSDNHRSSHQSKSFSISQSNHLPHRNYSPQLIINTPVDQTRRQERQRNEIRYIDEDRIEHLDLANNRLDLSLSSDLHFSDPSLLLFKPVVHRSNLLRMKTYSISDSEIDYKHLEDISESRGSSGFIHRNGTINFSVILVGLHAVICNEHHLKLCELVMNILDVLFDLNVLQSTEIDPKEYENFQLAVDIILRILKRLGCTNCQPRARCFVADQLRGKVLLSLNKLRLINEKQFERCFLNFVNNGELIHVFDILHALCGYCSEPNAGLGHYLPYIGNKTEIHSRQTYSNNFEAEPKTIDGLLLNFIFKPLITRLNRMEEYLLTAENFVLYGECRAFLIYMMENHGGIFRLTIFSALLEPEKQLRRIRLPTNDTRIEISLPDGINGSVNQHLHTFTQDDELSMIDVPSKSKETGTSIRSASGSFCANQEDSLYVDLPLIRTGLLRLHFLLESCPPGSLPDPEFLNSLLILNAPMLSKAAFLLECAYFIRRCSSGQWPEWMRMNTAAFYPYNTFTGRTNGSSNLKINKIYQAAAARMFYLWGEALSSQLESILDVEQDQFYDELFDDYYNEAIVNPSGHDCPYSLQLIVCLLLYEITLFLRETYETLPKLSSLTATGPHSRAQPQRTTNSQPIIDTHSPDQLRMNSVVSHTSNRSTISLTNEQPPHSQSLSATIININPLLPERHISFAMNTENELNESHHTVLTMNDEENTADGNIPAIVPIPTSRSKLIRRNSAKLRKPSVRTKDKNANRSSFRTRRRSHASNLSTDTDGHQSNLGSSSQDPIDDHHHDEFDVINTRPFPWIKIVLRIFKKINSNLDKQMKSGQNLVKALLNMYQSSASIPTERTTQRFSTYLFGEQTMDYDKDEEMNKHFRLISTYLEKQVGSLVQIPLMILCKSSVLLEEEHYSQILPLSWQHLLDRNEELSSCAATLVILTAARAGHLFDQLIRAEMEHSSAMIRYHAILRFEILWRFRYQFWIRLEDGAHSMMKILPPSIEFVLPSPALGIANLQVVDPPWMPHAKSLVQQVALNQEEVRAVVTTSKTRKKHQQELIHSALMTEEISKQVARENFAISTVPMLQAASFEPLLHQLRDDEEEVHMDDDRAFETSVQLRQAQGTFPSAFSTAIFQLVEMLEDESTIDTGAIISGAARQALWICLVDEPSLLIRYFFEKLSQKERRIKSLQSLHRLMIYLTDIPSQFAHAIFNYVLGLLLSMVRSPLDDSQELIIAGLALLWQIIPYLHGLVLKDFKQILRKEQAEMMILITGNIPSTKKVIIHGPDLSQIPTQALIAEDTQFSNVLQEALEFFGIPDSKRDRYYLIDAKNQRIQIPDTYVRDFYFFRRNIHPQLALVYRDPKQSQRQLEQIAIGVKTMELSKVLFARYLIESTPFNQIHNCITFFHDELLKSPLFPRKSLEADFNLYTKISETELWTLDMLHKYNWIKLISCILFNMDGKTTTTWDITAFLPVINGSFILHCEDLAMLRFCLATYINIVKHFRHIFATNGYLLIMPSFLRVYSNIQSNPMLKKSIEYCCRQFFILHRIPFILQMLGSISQLLDADEQSDVTDTNKIQPISLFRLLMALEQTHIDTMRDEYSILELVKNDSSTTKTTNAPTIVAALGQGALMAPLMIKSLDFCYADDEISFTLLNCVDVCVTVVAYAPDSIRSLQMLGIIDILLPKYFDYLKDRTIQKHGREEMKILEKLSIAIKTMINACESLTRTFVEPKSDIIAGGNYKLSRGSHRSPSIVPDEDSMNRFIDDRTKSRAQDADERKQASEFRWPRDTLLSIVSTYVHFSTQRFKELVKLLNDPTLRLPELLDAKSHIRLADIAHTLLKLSTFDTLTISCHGIQSYFQKLLPFTNWSQEQLRTTLNLVLRRTDRMFLKVCKKPTIKRCFDWEATAGLLNGIYLTIDRHPYVAYFPNLKTLVSGCIALILNENVSDVNHSVPRLDTPTFPKEFSRAVIKLVGRYLLAIKYQPHLEVLTSNNWSPTNLNSTLNHLLNFLLPLMFWAGSGRKDAPKLHSIDISYIVTIILSSIKPPAKLASTMGGPNPSTGQITTTGKQFLMIGGEVPLPSSNLTHKSMRQLKDLLKTASLLGLKILIIGFSKQLKREWQRITQAMKSMCNKQSNITLNLLSFIDFIVSYKTPIYLLLRPFLSHYMHSVTSETDYEMIRSIQQKLSFETISPARSTGNVLHELLQELNQLKAELTDESKPSSAYEFHLFGTEKVRFDTEQDNASHHRMSSTFRFRRHQQIDDHNMNAALKKRTEKIRIPDSLGILEPYYARCKTRCTVSNVSVKRTSIHLSPMADERSIMTSPHLLSATYSHPSIPLLRSVEVATENIAERLSTDEKTEPKLRTFHGWKRNTAHSDKPRLSKSVWLTHISSEPTTTYDATKEMHSIFRSVRQIDESNSDRAHGLSSDD